MTDGAGELVWRSDFSPFGSALPSLSTKENDLRFPGQWAQAETGLIQNWHRDYDPTLGRYLQADPLGLAAGQSLYGYVGGNPVNFVDPEGLYCQATNDTVVCTPDQAGWPSFEVPRPEGWPDELHSDWLRGGHRYLFEFTYYGAADIDCVRRELRKLPTPTPGSRPASVEGTLNDALFFGAGDVMSYIRGDMVVNVTTPDHTLRHGFVARRVVRSANHRGITIQTYGEGNSFWQWGPWGEIADGAAHDAWFANYNTIMARCTC